MPTTVSTKLWLRTFALIDRETIADERDPSILTETMRLHRLVREVATARCADKARDDALRRLVEAVTAVYPTTVFDDPGTWPRARRLDALALALVHGTPLAGTAALTADLLSLLALYRHSALGAYGFARSLEERSLAIREQALGPEHPDTIRSLGHVGFLIERQGHLDEALPFYERALAINRDCPGGLGLASR